MLLLSLIYKIIKTYGLNQGFLNICSKISTLHNTPQLAIITITHPPSLYQPRLKCLNRAGIFLSKRKITHGCFYQTCNYSY
jgi:hypothetical protein